VIIENQLGRSDHDHLGKVLTYLSAFDAKIAIWIVGQPRAEHVSAVAWLNESNTSADFYLIKAEAISIGSSSPALLLTQIVGPGDNSTVVANEKKQLSERHHLRQEFWNRLLSVAKSKTKLHSNISSTTDNWVGASAGATGLGFNYVIGTEWWRVELYIDRGKDSVEENKYLFDSIHSYREKVEHDFGESLSWERLDEKRASRIAFRASSGGYRSAQEDWATIHSAMVDAMIRLERSIKGPLKTALSQYSSIHH
jgi:uncharacterized protein DUF4268